MSRWPIAAALALGFGLAFSLPGWAQTPSFQVPIDCEGPDTCWIYQYVDRDPGPGWADYFGGSRSYDGHKGTDFGITGYPVMEQGIDVVAAADGVVGGVRDGMADSGFGTLDMDAVGDQSCGNAVRLEHGDGWATLYCHLKNGSVSVAEGQEVKAGEVLGLIGQSGAAEFPHVQFTVLKDREPVDPFSSEPENLLWADPKEPLLRYPIAKIYNHGFADGGVDWGDLQNGAHREKGFPADAEALVMWMEVFGVEEGDELTMVLTAPDGTIVVEHQEVLEKAQIRLVRFAGRNKPDDGWLPGVYNSVYSVVRMMDGVERGAMITNTTLTVQ